VRDFVIGALTAALVPGFDFSTSFPFRGPHWKHSLLFFVFFFNCHWLWPTCRTFEGTPRFSPDPDASKTLAVVNTNLPHVRNFRFLYSFPSGLPAGGCHAVCLSKVVRWTRGRFPVATTRASKSFLKPSQRRFPLSLFLCLGTTYFCCNALFLLVQAVSAARWILPYRP